LVIYPVVFIKKYREKIIKLQTYYKTEKEFKTIHQKLKLYSCPHCKKGGYLILHGYLRGNSEDICTKMIKRGHRIFCSNRRKQGGNGCGKTISILLCAFIKYFTITSNTVWTFLNNLKRGLNRLRALGHTDLVASSIYRIYERFKHNQTVIRTLLSRIKKPPDLNTGKDPVIATIIHLESVFKKHPITRFQYYFQTRIF